MAKGNDLIKRGMDTVDVLINNRTDFKKTHEGEITKRKATEAQRDGLMFTNAVGALANTINEIIDCIKVQEEEKTKRTAIEAQRDVLIKHLQKARKLGEKL